MRREEYVALVEEAGFETVEVLKDVDYGASMEAVAPDQVADLLERTGARREDLVGTVRSVTLRAVKPA
jgi:sugar phosphate isomerase/epimerase